MTSFIKEVQRVQFIQLSVMLYASNIDSITVASWQSFVTGYYGINRVDYKYTFKG